MNESLRMKAAAFLVVATILLLAPPAWGRSHRSPFFQYVAGTEPLPQGCDGKLEVKEKALEFQCGGAAVTVPYKSITEMEYRPTVSKGIRKMKLNWVIKPSSSHGKHEGFFTVLFSDNKQTHAIILKVSNATMRPYMAEIDLKTGQTIHSHSD